MYAPQVLYYILILVGFSLLDDILVSELIDTYLLDSHNGDEDV